MKTSTFSFCSMGLLYVGLLGLTTACSVYVPMLAPMPIITEKGKAEAGISLRLPTQVEAYAAYSPIKHVLVFADGAHLWGIPGNGSSLSSTQGEADVGSYTTFKGDRWYLGGLAGYGANTYHSGCSTHPAPPELLSSWDGRPRRAPHPPAPSPKRRRGGFNDMPTGLFRVLPWHPFSFSEKGPGDEAPAEGDNDGT